MIVVIVKQRQPTTTNNNKSVVTKRTKRRTFHRPLAAFHGPGLLSFADADPRFSNGVRFPLGVAHPRPSNAATYITKAFYSGLATRVHIGIDIEFFATTTASKGDPRRMQIETEPPPSEEECKHWSKALCQLLRYTHSGLPVPRRVLLTEVHASRRFGNFDDRKLAFVLDRDLRARRSRFVVQQVWIEDPETGWWQEEHSLSAGPRR